MTGADLVRQLQLAARARNVRLGVFVAPLTSDPRKFIRQLELAKAPKPATIERIAALIAGQPVPPAPLNNFQAHRPRSSAHGSHADRSLARQLEAKAELEQRLQVSRLAHERKQPGETLHAAAMRLERELSPTACRGQAMPGARA